jgi:hypothetical protein
VGEARAGTVRFGVSLAGVGLAKPFLPASAQAGLAASAGEYCGMGLAFRLVGGARGAFRFGMDEVGGY